MSDHVKQLIQSKLESVETIANGLAEVVHPLVGVAGTLGATHLAELATELEGLAVAGDWERARRVVRHLERSYRQVEAELKAMLTGG